MEEGTETYSNKGKKYKCTGCEKQYKFKDSLKKHFSALHSGVVHFQCEFCQKGFFHKADYERQRHGKLHSLEGKKFECDICHCGFKSGVALSRHVRTEHGLESCTEHECIFCLKRCSDKPSFRTHIRLHTREVPFLCKFCPAELSSRTSLSLHSETHSTDREHFDCVFCQRSFLYKGSLLHHLLTHTGEQPHFCNVCPIESPTKEQLKLHARKVHGAVPERRFECDLCPKLFYTKGGLQRHISCHHLKETPFKCQICGNMFGTSGEVKRHMRVHTEGERNYSCRVCKRKFGRKGHLTEHMRVHTEERNYPCAICQKKFKRKGDVKKHMIVHSAHKPYPCNISRAPGRPHRRKEFFLSNL